MRSSLTVGIVFLSAASERCSVDGLIVRTNPYLSQGRRSLVEQLAAAPFSDDLRNGMHHNIMQGHPSMTFSHYSILDDHHPLAPQAAQATYNWAANFVARHNLCPWAERSVRTRGALNIVTLTCDSEGQPIKKSLLDLATLLHGNIESGLADPHAAIIFCVLLPPLAEFDDHWSGDFEAFYDWYVRLEDSWLDQADEEPSHVANAITLAPFHPDWRFDSPAFGDTTSDAQELCAIEKQSPYPTLSLVSSRVIERAGEAATQKIIDDNEQTLAKRSMQQWRRLYQQAVYGSGK